MITTDLSQPGELKMPQKWPSVSKKRGIKPSLFLSSTALRAAETAKITAEILDYPKDEIRWEKELFLASPNQILKLLRMQKDSVDTILIFGHNPGLNDLISHLGGTLDNLPTSGQFGFKVKSEHWAELKPETAEPWFIDYPKKKKLRQFKITDILNYVWKQFRIG